MAPQPQADKAGNIKAPLELDASSLTFGGTVPTETSLGSGELSLEEKLPQPEKLSVIDKDERPAILGDTNVQRTAKIQFALGDKAPSPEVTSNALATGKEADLRAGIAAQKDSEDQAAKVEVIKRAAADGSLANWKPEVVEQVVRNQPKNDPAIIIEQAYARALTTLVPQIGNPSESVVNRAIKEDVGHVAHKADVAEALITKQEIAKSAAEDYAAIAKEQSWSGWAVDKAKTLASFGMYDWYKTYNAVTPVDGILKGNNWAEQIQYLYTLPPSEMHKALHSTLDKLARDNPSLASEFAEAAVSFSASDQFLTNLGNVTDIALTVPVGRIVRSGKAIAESLAKGGEKEMLKESTTAAYQSAVVANAPVKTDIAAAMSRMGDVGAAATHNTAKRLAEVITKEETPLLPEQAQARLPSLFNPGSIGNSTSLSALQTQKVVSLIEANTDTVVRRISDLIKINRLPEDAERIAIDEMKQKLTDRFAHVNNSVADVRWEITPAEHHPSNVTHVSMLLGDREGIGFDDQYRAWRWAKSVLKLNDDDINVEQNGVKFFIKVTRPVDETSPGVRQALTIDTKAQTPQGLGHAYLGWLGSGNSRISMEQIENRIVAASGSSALVAMMKNIAKPIGALNKGEYKRLIRIMEDNRADIDPITNVAGTFHTTIADLDRAYQRLHGQSVTEKEAKAYFSAVQLNDIDYTMRNLNLYRDRARQGIETIQVFDKATDAAGRTTFQKSQKFLGKLIDELPIEASRNHPATVAIHRSGEKPEVLEMSMLNTPERVKYIKDLQNDGYKIIQTHNPSRTVLEKFGNDNINFIITKDVERSPLNPVQLPYRPGWHQEYDQQWYVKQAKVKKVEKLETNPDGTLAPTGITKHFYEGDVTAMAHTTEAEAKEWASKFEIARQILNGERPGDLADYLRKELPIFNYNHFVSKFEPKDGKPAVFDKNTPFTHTFTGKYTTDMADHAEVLKGRFENLYDEIRSPWNLMANENKKFVGQRDEVLDTVKNIGTKDNPVFQLAEASMIDPMSSLSRGMHDVMRNKYMVDYKHSAVEQWMSEFGHLLSGPSSKEDMWANAVTYLHQGNFVQGDPSNYAKLNAAKQSRRAILEFLGTESPDKMSLNTFRQEIANTIYKIAPPKYSELVNPYILSTTKDPIRLMQGFAFHTSFFMNPFQGLQNAMVMANALALGGLKSGLPGFRAGWGMQMLRYNSGEAGLEAVAKVSGWEKKWVKEAWDGIQDTGRLFVEGEHAWKDDLADPRFFQGTFGNVLDKGQFFFREGERVGRLTAWATAYHEWRIANPEAVFDATAIAKVLARSDDMTVNMTRASKAAWQQGIFAVPTQFWAWNARNTELMLGRWQNGLSVMDRAKLISMNSLLYGVPLGAAAPMVGGFFNPWDSMRQYFVDKGWNVNDKAFDALYGGLIGMAYHQATGRPGNLNETLGLGGSNLVKDMFDDNKSLGKWLVGVAGTRMFDAATSTKPFARYLYQTVFGDSEKFQLTVDDFLDVARNIKIVDTSAKALMALNSGKYITKNGAYLGDVSTTETLLNVFTNSLPRALTDPKAMQDVTKTRETMIQEGSKELQKNVTAAVIAAINGDEKMANVYRRRANTLVEAMDLRPDERISLFNKLYEEINPQSVKVPFEFWAKKAPPKVATDRYNAWRKSTSQPNGNK